MFLATLLLFSFFVQTDLLSITGVVSDSAANPVAGVHVHMEEPTAQQQWDVDTKPDGTFRFDRLPFGTYRITVSGAGYFDTAAEVRLESSKTVEFTLVPSETLKQELEVIARPEPINTDAVSPQNVVNDEVIQSLPYTGRQNFLNALSLTPGVLRDNTDQIHVHGSRSSQIRYELDGLFVTDPTVGGLGSNIPIDAIESVDMDLANYSAEFGKTSGGVVRVHSQFIGDRYRFNVTDFIPGWDFRQKSIAEFSPRLLFSGPLVRNKLWFMYSGTVRYIHSFLEELQFPENERTRTQSSADQLLKLQWNLKESHVLTLDVLHNSDYFGNSGLSIVRPLETTTNALHRGLTVGLSDRNTIGGKLFETTAQYTRKRDSDLAKGVKPLEVRPDVWSGNFYSDRFEHARRFHGGEVVSWNTEGEGLKHRIRTGGEFDWVDSNLQLDRRPFTMFDEQGNLKASVSFTGANFADVRNQEYGAFIQDRMIFNSKLQAEAGLRYDRERVTGRNNLAPRASLSYLPFGTERTKVSGGVGLFYDNIILMSLQLPQLQRRLTTIYNNGVESSAPTVTDVRVDPGIRNPRAVHWNAAWENEWATRWVTRIEYIQKTGQEQVRLAAQTTPSAFDLVYNNSGTSKYHAVELSLDRPIRTNLRFLASYTYSSAKARPSLALDFPDPAVERLGEVPVEWDTPHRFIGWGYFPLPSGFAGSFSVEAHSGFPYSWVNDLNQIVGGYHDQRLPAYFVTNASVEKQLAMPFGMLKGKRVAFRIGVTNLFNRFNPRFVDANVDSLNFRQLSDSSRRHFSARVRILKK